MMENNLRLVAENEARVSITYKGEIGDLPDPVSYEAGEADVKQWVTEALRGGGVPGVPRDEHADLTDFVVERFRANEARPVNVIIIRPKTPFGL